MMDPRSQVAGMIVLRHLKALELACGLAFFAPIAVHADTACQVALPNDCLQSEAGKSAANDRPLRILGLDAHSESECLDQAREAAFGCARPVGRKPDFKVQFRYGPVETVRQIAKDVSHSILGKNVRIPIVYGKNFETESEQYDYRPQFAPGVVNFTNNGLILIRHRNYLQTRDHDDNWTFVDFQEIASEAIRRLPDVASFEWVWDNRSASSDQRIYFDADDRAYTLVQGGRTKIKDASVVSVRPYLLVSRDGGATWVANALDIPDQRATWRARIEHNDGNNDRSSPPPVLLYDRDENVGRRSARLYLYNLKWLGKRLIGTQPIPVSEKSLLQENHSGAANSVVSSGDRVYIVYPGAQSIPGEAGTPAHMVIFNKKKQAIESDMQIGTGGSATNVDNHNIPGICLGKGNTIHVLLPGHQEALRFRTGKIAAAGISWGTEDVIGQMPTSAGGYTYGSLNCDSSGNIYITSRWAGDAYRFQLVFLHRNPSGAWTNWSGKAHRVLVDPGRSYYGAWRQKLSLNSSGHLFLWYSYYPNQLTKAEFQELKWRFPFHDWNAVTELQPKMCVKAEDPRCWLHPMPEVTSVGLTSKDGGKTWSFFH